MPSPTDDPRTYRPEEVCACGEVMTSHFDLHGWLCDGCSEALDEKGELLSPGEQEQRDWENAADDPDCEFCGAASGDPCDCDETQP